MLTLIDAHRNETDGGTVRSKHVDKDKRQRKTICRFEVRTSKGDVVRHLNLGRLQS